VITPSGAARRQVSSSGRVELVSGVGGEGTSAVALRDGTGLGPKGAKGLASLLQEAMPPLLTSIDIRL
jgi:hypothetical protein